MSLLLPLAAPDSLLPDSVRPPAPVVVVAPRPRRAALVPRLSVPAAFVAYGVATLNRPGSRENALNHETREELLETFPRFHTRLDNYTRHAPTAAAYVLPLLGVKGRYHALDFTLLYLTGRALNDGLTSQLKKRVGEWRPGPTPDQRSFPSAHTSEAFFSATLLYEQYREQNPWIGAGGYAVAAATGTMRMLNDKHWLSDVVAGAGIGIASAEAAWYLYPWLRRRLVSPLARRLVLAPVAGPHMGGLAVAFRP
ncbi:phosphatase PAP2 family protein [Hymenobacter sp. 15J16-1T3B]|uniref:phosphatase PAP2 family protein n=1 Tax=Hymenobacter sp. 15J16-1T3B TaxID=2886941 RepID=UPI001D0F4FAB|nr:phosphatase PAP2 family protein [Hymenobacter sp. 15J16-1T3B]